MRRAVALALGLALLAPATSAGTREECGALAPFVTECGGSFTFEGDLGIIMVKLFLGDFEVRLRQPGREYVMRCGGAECGESGLPPLPGVPTDFTCRALPGEGGLGPAGAWGCGFSWA